METVNGTIAIQVPEGFRVMDKEELNSAYNDVNGNRWGMTDETRHITVSIFWHRSNPLLSVLADSKDICRSTETKLRRAMKDYGYSLDRFYTIKICGKDVFCFCHRYELRSIGYVSDVCTIKLGRDCYTLYLYSREENEAENRRTIEDIVDSIRF